MSEGTTEGRIATILVETLGVAKGEVTLDVRLMPDPADPAIRNLGADSLDGIEIVMAIEEEFGIEISDEEGEDFTGRDGTPSIATLEKLVSFVDGKLAETRS